MHSPEYKAAKVASVSHLEGGGLWEVNNVTLVAPAAYFLWCILQKRQSFFRPYTVPAYITDFLLQCCVILFAETIYSDSLQVLNGLLILPAIATILQPASEPKNATAKPPKVSESNGHPLGDKKSDDKPVEPEQDPLPVKPFITAYRGAMIIVTCTSILAVDFPVFPRRFAKTESFGTSLMDMGVGSFVFAAGIVAARQMLKEQYAQASPTMLARLKAALRHSLPLIVLGFVRLYSVKGLDYAEHVSEYGVHWNFFFTLALLPPFTALLLPLLKMVPSLNLLAFIIGCVYESVLFWNLNLKLYLFFAERKPDDWVSQNREGLISFIGYFAIFISGMGIGKMILPRDQPWDLFPTRPEGPSEEEAQAAKAAKAAGEKDPMDEDEEWLMEVMGHGKSGSNKGEKEVNPLFLLAAPKTAWFGLAKWTAIWFIINVWGFWHYGPHLTVSRRIANLGYVIWVCAFNVAQLLLFCLIEMLMFPKTYSAAKGDKAGERARIAEATSKVLHAFNRNGLVLFLLANLMTGAINMVFETWYMDDTSAMVVLVAYIATVCAVALGLDHYDISVKL